MNNKYYGMIKIVMLNQKNTFQQNKLIVDKH